MQLVRLIFFGNYFYGICAVALSIEASLQQRFPLNHFLYYAAVFAVTVFYYTIAYRTDKAPNPYNKRSAWYAENRQLVNRTQSVWLVFLFVYGIYLMVMHMGYLPQIRAHEWILLVVFPLTGGLYYGLNSRWVGRYSLRSIGWMKPFVIGFTWAGLVTVYPVLFYCIEQRVPYEVSLVTTFLFIKNFMFVTVLCIIFDIKDYAVDHNLQLKTFVVRNGLRKTIFYILLPLSFLGLVSFITYGVTRNFHPMKILLNIIPFAVLILVTLSMHRRKPILYYLIIIDGIMLVKALCGSVAMEYF